MKFTDNLKALKALARVQAALGGVFISNKTNVEIGHSYSSLDNMLIQLSPFLAAEGAMLVQRRIQSPAAYDAEGRVLLPAKEIMITSFVHLDSGESIDDCREITVAAVNNIVTSQILAETETYARKSALRCLFAAHDSDTVPTVDARTLMTDAPATKAATTNTALSADLAIAQEEARIAMSIDLMVHNPDHESFFKEFLASRKLTPEMENFAIQAYTQAIKVPKAVKAAAAEAQSTLN